MSSCKSQFWLPLHAFKLSSADGLHPFPVKFGWIHAVCVVAMRNEMQVYSQWTLENLTVGCFVVMVMVNAMLDNSFIKSFIFLGCCSTVCSFAQASS